MLCAIWYYLYNLKNVKNTHRAVLILVKLQAYAFEVCGLEEDKEESFKYKRMRIDYYWRSVRSLVCDDGQSKYMQLFALVKCVLSLSHGNAVPGRRFSINKKSLDSHGTATYEGKIVAQRLSKFKTVSDCTYIFILEPIYKKPSSKGSKNLKNLTAANIQKMLRNF